MLLQKRLGNWRFQKKKEWEATLKEERENGSGILAIEFEAVQ